MRVSVRGGEDPPFYDLKGGCRCRASAPRKWENPVLFVCFVFSSLPLSITDRLTPVPLPLLPVERVLMVRMPEGPNQAV